MPEDSHTKAIDKVIKNMLKKLDDVSPDVAVKIIAQAINWEKVKNHIQDKDDEFDPDKL